MLTNFPYDPLLDLAPWIGQRQASFRFDLINGVSGKHLGEVTPLRTASLTHNTLATIKRQLSITFGASDTAAINPITDRVTVTMRFPNGQTYPLGKYMFSDSSKQVFTTQKLANVVLNDEMYLVDQAITEGFDATTIPPVLLSQGGSAIPRAIGYLLRNLPVKFTIDPSPFLSQQGWGIGTGRGSIVEALALAGDYFSPWFGNDGLMHFIRAFNPAMAVPDFDWDAGKQVIRSSILESSDILNAPNRFVVISNASADASQAVVGIANAPVNAPHSFESRGFVIAAVYDLQALNASQVQVMANNLAQRQTIFERTTVNTAPDPRHDSYNVIKWRGDLWLELAWRMTLVEGAPMSHTLRKAYR